MSPTEAQRPKVHFAEHEDIFIIREDDDDKFIVMGMSSSQVDVDAYLAREEETFQDSVVDIQKNTRECVFKWFNTPYWRLLEGSVDDQDGEAKDVQKYITSFARIEVDGDVPRGLERQLCRSHHEARKALADAATHAVLSNDFRLRYENQANTSDEEIWKELRHIYKEHSRGAKAFARKMGKADEAAVQRDNISEEQALELIEELQERTKSGAIRVQRCSSTTTVDRRSLTSKGDKERRRSRSVEPLSGGSDHVSSSPKKDKGKRKTPFRVPSLSSMKNRGGDNKEPGNDADHAADLFHEVDKKGKTKRSSRWRSLKKRFSKSVHKERDHQRTQ